MRIGRRADLITGIGLVALATYVYVEASAMPAVKQGLGPGGYPIFAAAGLIILGGILVAQSIYKLATDNKAILTVNPKGIGRMAIFVAMTAVYIQAIPLVGFILASLIYLPVTIRFFGYARLRMTAIFSVVLTLGIFFAFRYGFLVLIPTGSVF